MDSVRLMRHEMKTPLAGGFRSHLAHLILTFRPRDLAAPQLSAQRDCGARLPLLG